MTVDAKANIFAAGIGSLPQPGGGGGGARPALVELPEIDELVVTFPCVAGLTNCCSATPDTPALGDLVGPTDVESYGGISGIVHGDNGMFLIGVFLGPDAPEEPAPERLDFTEDCPSTCVVERIEPELGQTFYIGNGERTPYPAPEGATRLFLGFADGYLYQGLPGWYDNNLGRLDVTVRFEDQ